MTPFSRPDQELEISEEFYRTLHTLTIDPPIELEKLRYMSIVSDDNAKQYCICWFKKVCERDGKYYATVQVLFGPYNEHSICVTLMNSLAATMQKRGIPIKR